MNGLGSTPFNVAVGGAEFNEGGNPAAYWSGANDPTTKSSALGYIPEQVWNESSYTTYGAGGNNLYAGSGGASAIYATPAWQTGPGVPASDPFAPGQHHRYLPDVSLTAAGHDGYLIYQEGQLYQVGGTSASSPSFAGLMTIVDQYTGGRNGNPNPRLYAIAAQNPATFHDTVGGTNAVPCAGGSLNCSSALAGTNGVMIGYSAGAGFDLATGWGSVDANSLAQHWGNGAPANPAITSLAPNPMTASATAQTLTINGSGFVAGATVKATSTVFNGNLVVTSLTPSQILATINTTAAAASWSIQVINPNGGASGSATLTVNAAPANPAITSLTPNPMTASATAQTLTINGSGFAAGATVNATSSVFTGTLTVTSLTPSQILATINTTAAAASWSIQVVNPGGAASSNATLTVNAAPANPAITSLTPNPMTASATAQTLTINGSGFAAGATVKATSSVFNGTLTVTSLTASQILATINTTATAATWSIQVVTAGGAASNSATLTVIAAPAIPVITSITPNPVTGSNTPQTITINGSDFVTGDKVMTTFPGGPAIQPQITSLSANQIQISLNVGITARPWTLSVVSPYNKPSSPGHFNVVAPLTGSVAPGAGNAAPGN